MSSTLDVLAWDWAAACWEVAAPGAAAIFLQPHSVAAAAALDQSRRNTRTERERERVRESEMDVSQCGLAI